MASTHIVGSIQHTPTKGGRRKAQHYSAIPYLINNAPYAHTRRALELVSLGLVARSVVYKKIASTKEETLTWKYQGQKITVTLAETEECINDLETLGIIEEVVVVVKKQSVAQKVAAIMQRRARRPTKPDWEYVREICGVRAGIL